MAILIKNPETERKARELAALHGQSITAAIDGALERALAELAKAARPTEGDIEAATLRMWQRAGRAAPEPPVSKSEWDEINAVPGFAEDDE